MALHYAVVFLASLPWMTAGEYFVNPRIYTSLNAKNKFLTSLWDFISFYLTLEVKVNFWHSGCLQKYKSIFLGLLAPRTFIEFLTFAVICCSFQESHFEHKRARKCRALEVVAVLLNLISPSLKLQDLCLGKF
jgi:hypothetical protein